MAKAEEVAREVAILKERVDNHIRFFWAAMAVFGVWLSGISYALYDINGKLNQLPIRVSQELIQQSSKAEAAGDTRTSANALDLAATLIRTSREGRATAAPQYFSSTSQQLREIALRSQQADITRAAGRALLELAAYKSNKEAPPETSSGTQKNIEQSFHTTIRTRYNIKMYFGATVFLVYTHGEMFESPSPPTLSNNVIIDGPAIFWGKVPDAVQTLDGIHWVNGVTFVNMRIRYSGGEVELRNVRFVNCTFEFGNDKRSIELASAIAAAREPLTIQEQTPS